MTPTGVYSVLPSPIGDLWLTTDGLALTGVYIGDMPTRNAWVRDDDRLEEARDQLAAYFAGERIEFDLPLAVAGTPFQRRVWQELRSIPYGETISYAELAQRIGQPTAVRAVGMANGKNPLSIIIPCHRVIGANGKLVGYGGGLERKRWLLEHEARVVGACVTTYALDSSGVGR